MNCIVNVSTDWGIGRSGQLLVSLKADLRHFAELTTGGTILYGRKTLETFPGGKPLKNRENIILTHNPDYRVEGATVIHSPEEGLQIARMREEETFWIIGGASVYRQFLPYCTLACVTRTFGNYPADAFFDNLDELDNWSVIGRYPTEKDEQSGTFFQFIDYINRSPLPY